MKYLEKDFENLRNRLIKAIPEFLEAVKKGGTMPGDFDDITRLTQIDAIGKWERHLASKANTVMDLVDQLQTFSEAARDNYYELENEKLPDEGRHTGALIGE